MINRKQMRLITLVFAVILLIGTQLMPSAHLAQAQKRVGDASEVLQGLTKEQRAALKQLDVQTEFVVQPGINVESETPVSVIIEFKQDPAALEMAKSQTKKKRSKLSLAEAEEKVEASHREFKKAIDNLNKVKLSKSTVDISITNEYRDALNGVAITLPGTSINTLLQTGLIKRVWKNSEVQLDLPEISSETISPKMIDSIPQIGVDRLHEEGITGEGIKVGVLDTGIDYNHPDLTNVYKGYRATEEEDAATIDPNSVKGWDFVDNDADPMETTYEDWLESSYPEIDGKGNSYYTSHGTHVSGTVAGQQENNVDYAVKGVAPGIDLYSYRVLGPYGSGGLDGIIGAIDKSIGDGMDVINLSLGTGVNDPIHPLSIAVNNAMLSGVVTVVSAGNAGPEANTLGSPGAAALSISVGASDVSQSIPTYSATAGDVSFTDVQLLAKHFTDDLTDFQGQSYPIVYVGLGSQQEFEETDVTGKIALIKRGELAFDEKIRNAKEAGAIAAIIYNQEDGQIPYYLGESTKYLPAFRISNEDGEKLKAEVEKGTEFFFGELGNTQSVGDNLADFSSRGPVKGSYDIKPDVVAPGVAIFSTYPAYMNDPEGHDYDLAYTRMQGTSMSAPHVSGAAALILQEHPEYSPFEVKAALMNTSVEMQEDYSIYEIGAGRINVHNAVHATTSAIVLDQTEIVENDESTMVENQTGSMSFGNHYLTSDDPFSFSKKAMIKNASDEEKTYTIEAAFLQERGNRQDAEKNGVVIEVQDSLTLAGNDSAEIEASINIPNNAAYGTYEGYVNIVNGDEKVRIPFAIRISDKGFDFAELDRPAVPNEWEFHPFLIPFLTIDFQLKSPMKTIDIIVKDSETKEPIGIVGSIGELDADVQYYILNAFQGAVYPFTDDPNNPVAMSPLLLPEDDYIYELIGVDEQGEVYSNEQVVVVDNTPPEISFLDYQPGVIEIDESMYTEKNGHNAFWIRTNVYDSTIDLLNEKGLDYDQSQNIVAYFENHPFPGALGVEADGTMEVGVLPEEIENGALNLELIPIDMATNADMLALNRYTFIKKGSIYSTPKYDKQNLHEGDQVTMTVDVNNVDKLLAGEFDIEYDAGRFQFKHVKVNEAFSRYAEDNGLEVNLDDPTFDKNDWNDIVELGASIESDSDFEGFTGNIDFLDVTFELLDDAFYSPSFVFTVNDFQYQQNDEADWINMPVFYHDTMHIIPEKSMVQGYILPEALLSEDGNLQTMDYEEMGVKVYAKSNEGETYPGTVDQNGHFTIGDLPASENEYTFYIEVPGHLTSSFTLNPAVEINGEWAGNQVRANTDVNAAGDVNNDGVIDIHDIMRIVAFYGKSNDDMDINKDDIVDEIDIRYIEKNFLKAGPDAKNKVPLEKLGPKGLYDFLKALGLEPAE